MPTASKAITPTPPIEWAALPFIFASRYAGKNGLQSCSPRPKNRTETRTMPTVRLSASTVRSEEGPVIIPFRIELKTAAASEEFDRRGPQSWLRLDQLHSVILHWQRADPFAGRREVRVEYGRRGHADRGLADTAPGPARRHDDRFDLRHLSDPHRVIGVEVRLLDVAVFDRALLQERT